MAIRKIGIIGTGKVAVSFASLLLRRGFQVGFYGRSHGAAVEAAAKTSSILSTTLASATLAGETARQHALPIAFESTQALIDWCDAVGFVVSDGAISQVARTIQRRADRVAFHMSGALSTEGISCDPPWSAAFSLHPLRAFAKPDSDFDDIYFALELSTLNTESSNAEIREFVADLGVKTVSLRADQKVLYHAAAVIASNLFVALMDYANGQLRSIGIEEEELLWPLVDSTLRNMKKLGVKQALTGPIARGDFGTVARHLEALPDEGIGIYTSLSEFALGLSGAEESKKQAILNLLRSVSVSKGGNDG